MYLYFHGKCDMNMIENHSENKKHKVILGKPQNSIFMLFFTAMKKAKTLTILCSVFTY